LILFVREADAVSHPAARALAEDRLPASALRASAGLPEAQSTDVPFVERLRVRGRRKDQQR
jgi:hypothetical protein